MFDSVFNGADILIYGGLFAAVAVGYKVVARRAEIKARKAKRDEAAAACPHTNVTVFEYGDGTRYARCMGCRSTNL